jgi:hypothetical protein
MSIYNYKTKEKKNEKSKIIYVNRVANSGVDNSDISGDSGAKFFRGANASEGSANAS